MTTGASMRATAAVRQPVDVRVGASLPTRQSRPGYVSLAIALIVGLAAVGAYLYVQAGHKIPVVVVVRDVPAGHVIERSDLSTVAVAGGVTAIAAKHLDGVIGRPAAVHLLPNMLLQRSMVADAASTMSAANAQVGVAVKGGQIPADGLAPGDVVAVVALPSRDSTDDSASGQVLVNQAQVFSSRDDPAQAGGTLLTLVVPRAQATGVAAASGAGRIALIRVGRR